MSKLLVMMFSQYGCGSISAKNSVVSAMGLILLMSSCMNMAYAEDANEQGIWSGYDVKPLDISGDNLGDADNDGVVDVRDDCENVNADAVISNAGCAQDKDVIVQTVLHIKFDSDDWQVKKKYYSELKRFTVLYQQHPNAYVTIEGHTDSTGADEHNMKLSQFRAQAVTKLLTDNYGIDKHKISWAGYGETKPVADNKTKSGRQKNRRIVAVIRAQELHEIRNWSVH